MHITVIGTGYVGLVTGTCFAEMGNIVTCVDVDSRKIENLRQGILPIYEPGLDTLVEHNYRDGRLLFSTSLPESMQNADALFIAVGTPPGEDGSADLQYVLAVAREIGQHLQRYQVVVDKSTVPVGTAEKVRATLQAELDQRAVDISFDVVSNPEFLKEGAAVEDFMRPDRIIVGADSERAREVMRKLYAPFNRNHQRVLFMGIRDAEMTKYAANAMLATKISFMNEIANLCERMQVDVEQVRLGIGADERIGYHFIYPGAGYGGSCFPKDVKALVHMAETHAFEPVVLRAVEQRNQQQKRVLAEKVLSRFGTNLHGVRLAIWGLAFKPGTDDLREASAQIIIDELLQHGAEILAYDPVAMDAARNQWPSDWFSSGKLMLTEHQYAALNTVDALLLITEWKPFRHPDFVVMKRLMRQAVIFDGRNQYDPLELTRDGFEYYGIGRGQSLSS